ncbi:hypothetical protein ACFQY7_12725 [Actinomadura luteofluorescens]|uniref:hypothetical protein n=1 Tax=Actinomadura luteofluorescens TaxID=46163 RepID=UPI00363E5540
MPLHPQTVSFLEQLASWTAVPPGRDGPAEPTIEEMRERIGAAFPVVRRELPRVRDIEVPGPGGPVPVRLYRPAPPERGPLPAVVYLHGGGGCSAASTTWTPSAETWRPRRSASC